MGDYLEFENNSATVFNVASSGQLTIGTSTNVLNSLFTIGTSSNIFTVFANGNANLLGGLNVSSTLAITSSTNLLGNVSIGTSSEPSCSFTIATSSNIFSINSVGAAVLQPANASFVIGTSTDPTGAMFAISSSTNIFTVLNNGFVGIGTSTPANQLTIAANGVPANDQLAISNAGYPVAAGGVNNVQLTYVGGTTGGIESGAERVNLTPGPAPGACGTASASSPRPRRSPA